MKNLTPLKMKRNALLLGLGWNFLFVGATTQLTETYRPEEKARAQALNDFISFDLITNNR